ncbi:hypothetical protein B0H63DRAFT_304543 [Podospora didyma]|uniref:Mid2 domain-containing protein n=1 Tax=Podospora didyma TaxID=330526 RepID=A0AAE0N599_9PEZI|nr:hypothetical protein B0H63DRAFT_304543 [Podospora didyma]
MFEGSNPKLQGSSGLPNISSGYFNITKTQPLVVTTTAASISTTTSSISSSATSSTTSSSKSSATSSAISPSSSSSSSSSLSFSLSSSSLSLSSSATSSITTIPTGSGAGVGTSAGVGAETNGGGISNAATDNTNGPAVSQVVPISVGVSVGVVSLAAIVALVLWLLKRKRKQQKLANTAELPSTSFTTAPSMGPPYGGLPPYNKPVEAMDHNERYSWAQSDATAVNKPHELSVPPIIKPQELHAHPALAELG